MPHSDLSLYRRLLMQARPYWMLIGCLAFVSLLGAPLALLTPLPLKLAVDSAIGTQPVPGFLQDLFPGFTASHSRIVLLSAGLLITISMLVYLEALIRWLLQTYIGEKLVLDFRARLFGHAQRLSLTYHDTHGTSDSTYRIQYDATAIQNVAITSLIPFACASMTIVGMVVIIISIDWPMALIALPMLPALYLVSRASRRMLRSGWIDVKNAESAAMSLVQESLGALRIVKAFGGEDQEQQRFMVESRKGVRGHLRMAYVEGGFDMVVGLILALGMAVTLVLGVSHVRSGQLTTGQLLIVMAYLTQVYAPMETIGKNLAQLQAALTSAERAFALLDETPDVEEREHSLPITRARGEVEFRSVSFAYDANRKVLRDISFKISPGSRVGIAGTSGAGKTTLINLLTRFYDPTEGSILLDSVEMRNYRVIDLRRQFAMVLQEPVLFSTSIRENIAYARPDATEVQIQAAAEAANARQFIENLPQGYDTQVGERGMQLSGGERQRISLARAFLRDAPLLILDEPTSSVDSRTEGVILEAMERLMEGRTTFVIAHRLDTLRSCDVRMQIEEGRLINCETLHRVPDSARSLTESAQ